jgi:hypothetical protein
MQSAMWSTPIVMIFIVRHEALLLFRTEVEALRVLAVAAVG